MKWQSKHVVNKYVWSVETSSLGKHLLCGVYSRAPSKAAGASAWTTDTASLRDLSKVTP